MGTNYQDERSHGVRVSDAWEFRGLKTVVLENKHIRLEIISDKGADISSFVHKSTDTELMFKTPWGLRNPKNNVPPSGDGASVWLDYYEGGWQTVVPHGGYPSKYYGADFGIHGDVNNIPWDTKIIEDTAKKCTVEFIGRSLRSPFEIKRVISLNENDSFIEINQEVKNFAEEDLNIVWLEHIAIGGSFLSQNCTLTVPDCTILTHPEDADKSSKLKPNFKGNWPYAECKDGSKNDFRKIPGKDDRSLDMAYFTNLSDGWYAVTNNDLNITWGVEFPKDLFRYIWYWRNFGGGYGYPWYGRCYNAGLEPCTSWHNGGVEQAENNGSARNVKSGEILKAKIKAGIIEDYSQKNSENPFK
tara:strand:- start:935 stop:2008 length:1074 start_codon:yes stop_codon:yes gene_type:complete